MQQPHVALSQISKILNSHVKTDELNRNMAILLEKELNCCRSENHSNHCTNSILVLSTDIFAKMSNSLKKSSESVIEINKFAETLNVAFSSEKVWKNIEAPYIYENLLIALKNVHNFGPVEHVEELKLQILNIVTSIFARLPDSIKSDCWNKFLPYSNNLSFAYMINKEHNPKVKSKLLGIVDRGIKSLKRLLKCAQVRKGTFTFLTISNQVAHSLTRLHEIILFEANSIENTSLTQVQLFKCLNSLIVSTPYKNLEQDLNHMVLLTILPKIINSNANVKVSALKCMFSLLTTERKVEKLMADIFCSKTPLSNIDESLLAKINKIDYLEMKDKFSDSTSWMIDLCCEMFNIDLETNLLMNPRKTSKFQSNPVAIKIEIVRIFFKYLQLFPHMGVSRTHQISKIVKIIECDNTDPNFINTVIKSQRELVESNAFYNFLIG